MTSPSESEEDAGASAAGTADEALASWVEWLVATYRLDRWPECWRVHRGIKLEAASLMTWYTAVVTKTARPGEWFAWHEGMWRFAERVAGLGRVCSGGCTDG